jgi:hypothetical protein
MRPPYLSNTVLVLGTVFFFALLAPLSALAQLGFAPVVTYGPGGQEPSSVAVADVNGDGKPDLVVANSCADSSCAHGVVSVLLGKGDGTFQPAVALGYSSSGYSVTSVAVADVNVDGKPDLVVAEPS